MPLNNDTKPNQTKPEKLTSLQLCKWLEFHHRDKWYMYKPEIVL